MKPDELWQTISETVHNLSLPENGEFFLFGAGLLGATAIPMLKETVNLVAVCDNNQNKHGQIIEGLSCISPTELTRYNRPFVLISSNKYYNDISRQLTEMNIQSCNLDAYVVRQNFAAFEEIFQLLADEESKRVYAGVLLCRITGNISEIEEYCCDDQYFCLPKFRYIGNPHHVFVNCGAYVGDTVEEIVKNSLGNFKKIYAFEPYERNYSALIKRKNLLKDLWALSEDQIICEMKGVGKIHGFASMSNMFSSSLLDKYISYSSASGTTEIICLDEYFESHSEDISFIIADIEGAEWDMLQGAETQIKNNKPMMAISIYHSIWDFFRIPLYLKDLVPEYKFKIRHHSDKDEDTILYCYVK